MKKLTAAIAALALYCSASAFGPGPSNELSALLTPVDAKVVKPEKVGRVITASFNKQFAEAGNVSWKEKDGLYFGYFKQNELDVFAAFADDGSLFAVARQLILADLPGAITDKLKDKYSDCTIVGNASKIDMNGETAYYVNVENKTHVKVLKFYEDGQVETFKSTKRKVLVGTVM